MGRLWERVPHITLSMAEISLLRGKVAIVDDDDLERLKNYTLVLIERPHTCYVSLYLKGGGRCKKRLYLHRFILNPSAGTLVDHINGNGLDCRRQNLRPANRQQNLRNSFTPKGRSGIKGVRIRVYANTISWCARIGIAPRRSIHLGSFKTKDEAVAAYNRAAVLHFGEFAREIA